MNIFASVSSSRIFSGFIRRQDRVQLLPTCLHINDTINSIANMVSWLITGANRGIGLELTKQLLAESSNVVIASCRDPAKASALRDLAVSAQGKLHIIPLDSSSSASIASSVDRARAVLDELGLDYLINNAAINEGVDTVFDTMSVDVLQRSFNVNVIGPALLAQTYLPYLEKPSTRGVILNMSSGLASIGLDLGPKCPSYSISKTAINMLTYKQARDRPDLIALAVDPGWVKTDMGGVGAILEPEESVADILSFLKSATKDHSGGFFNRKGEVAPW